MADTLFAREDAGAPERAAYGSSLVIWRPGGTEYECHEAIHRRRDQETFAEEAPPRDVIERVIETATWAPNHRLAEPWRFHVVGGARRVAMTDAIAREMEESGATKGAVRSIRNKVLRAPVTIIVGQAAAGEEDETRAREDYAACFAAIQNLLLAAHAEGLAAHLSTDRMIEYGATRRYLNLEIGDRTVALINLGYLRAGTEPRQRTRRAVRWDWE